MALLFGCDARNTSLTQTQTQPTSNLPPIIYNLEIPILMYHHIGKVPSDKKYDAVREDLTVSPENLETQLKWLKDQGYTSISMAETIVFARAKGEFPAWSSFALPKKPIIISLDDGYEDAYTNALPLLRKYNFSGSFAVITGKVGTPEYMTWEQIKILVKNGMEILSHTVSHPDLRLISDKKLAEELADSKKTLEDNLGNEIYALVYPSGQVDNRVSAAADAADYSGARTTATGKVTKNSPPYELPVVRIHGGTTLEHFVELLR